MRRNLVPILLIHVLRLGSGSQSWPMTVLAVGDTTAHRMSSTECDPSAGTHPASNSFPSPPGGPTSVPPATPKRQLVTKAATQAILLHPLTPRSEGQQNRAEGCPCLVSAISCPRPVSQTALHHRKLPPSHSSCRWALGSEMELAGPTAQHWLLQLAAAQPCPPGHRQIQKVPGPCHLSPTARHG